MSSLVRGTNATDSTLMQTGKEPNISINPIQLYSQRHNEVWDNELYCTANALSMCSV